MKHILAILGSPRRLGNSEIMAKEVCRVYRQDEGWIIPHRLEA